MDKLTLSVSLVNQLLGYLGKRPYEESFQLITAIQAEAQTQIPAGPVEVPLES